MTNVECMEGSAKVEERMRLVRRGRMAVAVACTRTTYLTRIAHGLKSTISRDSREN